MANIARLRENFALLIEEAAMPLRVSELLAVRHSNTQTGHRNIFIEDGMVVIISNYHKGYAISGNVKIIHRYLPQEIGELLVLYMWLVMPFEQRIQSLVYEKEPLSARLFPKDLGGRLWTSGRFREVLKHATRVGLGHALTIPAFRNVVIGISRRFMQGKVAFKQEDEDDEEEDDIFDEQAGHGSHVAGMVYARGIMEMAGVVADKRQRYRECSIE